MKYNEVLARNFVDKLLKSKIKIDRVFKLNSKGESVLNKRTKAYKIVRIELDFLLSKYSENGVKFILTEYNKQLKNSKLDIYCKIINFLHKKKQLIFQMLNTTNIN